MTTFPLMPFPAPPTLSKGVLTPRATAFGSVDCGRSSDDRWVVVVMAGMSGDAISAYTAPTINGVAMTQLDQQYSSALGDGHRGAVFIGPAKYGTMVSVLATGTPDVGNTAIYTLTGVRNPTVTFVKSNVAALTNTAGACVVGYFVSNYGSITSVANMIKYPDVSVVGVGSAYDLSMDAGTVTYTVSATSTVVLQAKLSWAFDY